MEQECSTTQQQQCSSVPQQQCSTNYVTECSGGSSGGGGFNPEFFRQISLLLFSRQAAVEDQEDGAHQVLEGQAAALVDTEEEEDPITGVRGASEP